MKAKYSLNVLYTNIGRGHPFYLDGVVEKLHEGYSDRIRLNIVNVFELSDGLWLKLWHAVRQLYKSGSQGGLIGTIYGITRKRRSPNRYGLIEKCLAAGIREYLRANRQPTLVAHPILVPMISDLVPTYYQHGEIAVPDEAIVQGVEKIFVPVRESADRFTQWKNGSRDIVLTGLCVENDLAKGAEGNFANRVSRLKDAASLTGGFFSSGAEPLPHIQKIIQAIESIRSEGQRAVVFCKRGGRLEKALIKQSRIAMYSIDDLSNSFERVIESEKLLAVVYASRRQENELTANLFRHLDYFVAPSHERTNWAVGLGIPMFILHPLIGTFSPLNREFLLKQGVAVDIDTDHKAGDFASLLLKIRDDGILLTMAQNGFGKYRINGFERIANLLADDLMQA